MTKVEVKVHVPKVPNFIKVTAFGNDGWVPIAELNEEQLRSIGSQWTVALLELAQKRRNDPI